MWNAIGHWHWQPRTVLPSALLAALVVCGPLMSAPAASPATMTHLLATPTALDLGDVQVGVGSASQQVKVTNVGATAVTLSGTYGSSGPFTSSGTCKGAMLAKGGSCQLTITFAPTTTAAFSNTVLDTLNGVQLNTKVVGQGYAAFRVTPTALDFDTVALGDKSAPQTVAITNLTPFPAVLHGTGGTAANFTMGNECQGHKLNPGASCRESITYAPTALGAVNTAATGTWNGQSYKVALHGIGIPDFQVTPTALDFGNVTPFSHSASQAVTITNRRSAAVTTSTTTNTPAPFSSSGTCPSPLAVGASCTINYVFTANTASSASATATITVNGQVFSIALTGRGGGITPPARPLLITPTALGFGTGPLGTAGPGQVVTLTNRSRGSITLNGTQALVAGFRATQTCQNATLAPGQSCHMTYQFSPSTLGAKSATATGSWNGQSFSIGLTGIGVPRFWVTPPALEFGPQHTYPDDQSPQPPRQRVTITNEGPSVTMNGIPGGSEDFAPATTCRGAMLATGASCYTDYSFDPHQRGRVLETTNTSWNGQSYPLSFGGLALADYLMSPTGLAFGSQAVGTESGYQTVTITNASTHALSMVITNRGTSGNFVDKTSCLSSLAANASCVIMVAFAPPSSGAKQGALQATFTSEGEGYTQSLHTTLAGTGS